MHKTQKRIILYTIIACTIIALYAITFIGIVHSRACYQYKKFDITSFFKDYQVSFLPDKILYSLLISCDQRTIVLSSFSMSSKAWRDFMNTLSISEIPTTKEDTLQQNYFPQYIQFQRSGHSIYLYDISRNKEIEKVEVKCLIELSL